MIEQKQNPKSQFLEKNTQVNITRMKTGTVIFIINKAAIQPSEKYNHCKCPEQREWGIYKVKSTML